jgi:hypothetical protein
MKQNVEVVSLIYRSTKYLKYIVNQLKSDLCKIDGWDVGVRIVANDATENVLEALKDIEIPYTVFNSPNSNEYYINRVYRGYNHCIVTSEYDNVCLVNSDDGFSNGWLSNLLKHHDGVNIPCSRLIESGKMDSGTHGVNLRDNNFGRSCGEFERRFDEWLVWVENHKEDRIEPYGLYMPCVFEKNRFIESGMYPEGNIYSDGRVGSTVGGVIRTGDEFFMHEVLGRRFGMRHVTVFDSLIYHIQEGEKDE